MPNKMYQKGYRFERKLVNEYRKDGHYATRTAGSHSAFDIIAIVGDEILLIQCKQKREKLKNIPDIPAKLKVKKLIAFKEKGKTIMEEI